MVRYIETIFPLISFFIPKLREIISLHHFHCISVCLLYFSHHLDLLLSISEIFVNSFIQCSITKCLYKLSISTYRFTEDIALLKFRWLCVIKMNLHTISLLYPVKSHNSNVTNQIDITTTTERCLTNISVEDFLFLCSVQIELGIYGTIKSHITYASY